MKGPIFSTQKLKCFVWEDYNLCRLTPENKEPMRKFQFVFFFSDLISGSCCCSPSLWKYDLSFIVLETKENSGINLVSRTPVGQPLVTVWDISPGVVCTLILMNSQSCYHLVIAFLSLPFFCLSPPHTHTHKHTHRRSASVFCLYWRESVKESGSHGDKVLSQDSGGISNHTNKDVTGQDL